MSACVDSVRDKIIETALPDVPFEGWSVALLEKAAQKSGYEKGTVRAVFPEGLPQAVAHFSDWADRRALESLSGVDLSLLRVRDRIARGAMARFAVLRPHREAVRMAWAWWIAGRGGAGAARVLWRTADRLWLRAGDTAVDYNRYTKRALLCAVLAATTVVWLRDESPGQEKTKAFLDRRIENVMQSGKAVGTVRRLFGGWRGGGETTERRKS